MKRLLAVSALLLFAIAPAQALVTCRYTATPLLMRSNGLAEPIGDIFIQCQGGAPFQSLSGTIQMAVSTPLGNRLTGDLLPDVTLAVETGAGFTNLSAVQVRTSATSMLAIENVNTIFGPSGEIAFRISGLRAKTAELVRALLIMNVDPLVTAPGSIVIVGADSRRTLGVNGTTTFSGATTPLPEALDFGVMLASDARRLTSRVTETEASMLEPAIPGGAATRILVRFHYVLPGGKVIVPDALAGSSAVMQTSIGELGVPASAGQYQAGPQRSLLLARVKGADPMGAGGAVLFAPHSGANILSAVGEAELHEGVYYAVYEVLDANPSVVETLHIPAWIVMPPDCPSTSYLIEQEVHLAPLSDVDGPSGTLPIPRFLPQETGNDCSILADCQAPYFPKLGLHVNGPTEFTLVSGGRFGRGDAIVSNEGGGLLAWRVSVRYHKGDGWVTFYPHAEMNGATLMFTVLPKDLPPGEYTADIVVTGMRGAGEIAIPLKATVTPAEPASPPPAQPPPANPPPVQPPPPTEPPQPPPPAPFIADVLNAGNRVPGPLAPGSLAVVLGSELSASTVVRVDGVPVRVVSGTPTEAMIELPPVLAGDMAFLRAETGGQFSNFWGMEVAPVSPAVLSALNEESGSVNSAEAAATTDRILRLSITGTKYARQPLYVKIHDREISELLPLDGVTPESGTEVVRFRIPGDLPAMRTAVLVCGEPDVRPGMRRCAQPFDVYLKRPADE